MNGLFLFLIKTYRALISPFMGKNCRFIPSCSVYAEEAIQKKGFLTGSMLAIKRISKCHPYHVGGFDPVE